MTETREPDGVVRTFTASDGYVHRYRHWFPKSGPRAYIVALHGIQSHSGWYAWSSARLSEAGYDVRLLDRRGSGLNDMHRGHAPSALRLMSDVAEFVKPVVDQRNGEGLGAPLILSAVSWGAKLAASVAVDQPHIIDGLMLLYPAIRSRFDPRLWQRAAIRASVRLGLGSRTLAIGLNDPALFTDDPQAREFIRQDPLALQRVTLAFLAATLDLTRRAEAAASGIACPTLVVLAGRDEIVDTAAMHDWAAQIAATDRTCIEYPRARHTLEFDDSREQFVADMVNWIESVR